MPWPDEDDRALEYTDTFGGIISAPSGAYQALGVQFENSNLLNHTYLLRGGALSLVSATNVGILSFWFRLWDNSMDGATAILFEDGGLDTAMQVLKQAANTWRVHTGSAGGTLVALSTTTFTSAMTAWAHCLVAWNGATNQQLYINNVSDITGSSGSNTNVTWGTPTDWGFCNRTTGNLGLSIDIADFYLNTDTFLDMTSVTNRAKFIDQSTLRPVNLGNNGSLPTGSQPVVFFGGPSATIANWQNNNGYGMGFNITGSVSTITLAPTQP